MLNNLSVDKIRIALVAHDACKDAMVAWVQSNIDVFGPLQIISTGTTGGRLKSAMPELDVLSLKGGPLGGGSADRCHNLRG